MGESALLDERHNPPGLRQPPPCPFMSWLWPGLAEAVAKADCHSVEYCPRLPRLTPATSARHR
jgi:hypothetical protein